MPVAIQGEGSESPRVAFNVRSFSANHWLQQRLRDIGERVSGRGLDGAARECGVAEQARPQIACCHRRYQYSSRSERIDVLGNPLESRAALVDAPLPNLGV